jgi:hypothetical protein
MQKISPSQGLWLLGFSNKVGSQELDYTIANTVKQGFYTITYSFSSSKFYEIGNDQMGNPSSFDPL